MLILKSRQFNDSDLLTYAESLSRKEGSRKDKLLHWEFGPLMTMSFNHKARNYLFSSERVPFHWDGAFYREPSLLLFYCTESKGKGGETLFVNTTKLWNSLSLSEQAICKDVTLNYKTQKVAHYGGEIQIPLVQTHPETGESILRMAERVTSNLNPVELEITGIDHAEEFYRDMVHRLYHKDFMIEHSWEKGDLIICDNFTYLHGRKELGQNLSRSFKRIQIL